MISRSVDRRERSGPWLQRSIRFGLVLMCNNNDNVRGEHDRIQV